MDKVKQLEHLKRTFEIYSSSLNILGVSRKYMNGDSPYKNLVIIIANEKDVHGKILMKLITSDATYDEVFCESDALIVFGKALRQEVQIMLNSLDRKVAKKLKSFKGVPVLVADYDVVDIFPYTEKMLPN